MAARKKWFASAIIAAVIVVVMLLRVRSNHSQPTYQGKPFSYWFREYCLERSNAGVTSEQILVAFRAMGSNAAPCLVKELLNTNHDSKLRKVCQDLADGLPVALQRIFPGSISADRRRDQAEDALFHTKPSIHVLLPLLINALNSPDVMQRRRALFALGGAGDGAQAAVPYLMVALKDRDTIARNLAAQSLGFLGADASVAVVDLIGALQDPPIRWKVVTALGNAGPAAQIAIPTLRQMIATDTGNDRLNIAAAIYKIDPTQSDAFAILADALRQKADPKLRIAAAWILREMGPVARDAVPDLVEAVQDQRREVWSTALDALVRVTTNNRAATPALVEKLKSSQADDRLNAAAWLVRIDPSERHGLDVLTEFIQQPTAGTGYRAFAIDTLAEAGAGARAAIPALKRALNDNDKEVREHAAEALKRIQSGPVK